MWNSRLPSVVLDKERRIRIKKQKKKKQRTTKATRSKLNNISSVVRLHVPLQTATRASNCDCLPYDATSAAKPAPSRSFQTQRTRPSPRRRCLSVSWGRRRRVLARWTGRPAPRLWGWTRSWEVPTRPGPTIGWWRRRTSWMRKSGGRSTGTSRMLQVNTPLGSAAVVLLVCSVGCLFRLRRRRHHHHHHLLLLLRLDLTFAVNWA